MAKYIGYSIEDYRETVSIGTKARRHKRCIYCHGSIPMGEPHKVHYFGDAFHNQPSHVDCEDEFMKSLNIQNE